MADIQTNSIPPIIIRMTPGYIGQSGYSGGSFVGSSGYSGFSGYSSASGYSGVSGLSGYSGTPGTGLTARGPWNSDTIYNTNDLVTYGGNAWMSLNGNNHNNVPVEGV